MRYHFGLGVGHMYLPRSCESARASRTNGDDLEEAPAVMVEVSSQAIREEVLDDTIDASSDEDGSASGEGDGSEAVSDEDDEDEFLARQEMYGM